MKHWTKKLLCAALLMVLAVGALAGCGKKEPESQTDTVVLWGGKHANFPWVDNDLVDEQLHETLTNGGTLTVIRVDGAPAVVGETMVYDALDTSRSKSGQQRAYKERLSDVHQALSSCTAQTGGLDTLGAIQLAAKQLRDSQNEKKLVIVDSGLSTQAPLNLTNIDGNKKPLSQLDTESTMQALQNSSNIPDLSGCTVIWYGLGEGLGDQKKLSAEDETKLDDFYNEYMEAAGAVLHLNNASLGEDELDERVPAITPVPVTKRENQAVGVPEETVFPESKIRFQDASAELMDAASAETALQEIIKQLQSNPTVDVYVCGTTTNTDTAEKCRALSKQRAQVVADILTRNGVSADQLHVVGFGAAGPNYQQDSAEQQNAANRAVTIIRMDSDKGQKIQAGTWTYD